MEGGYTSIPTSQLVGSVPPVVDGGSQDAKTNLQIFPPGIGNFGHRASETPYGEDAQEANSWSGIFSISSYQPYFNVDTDIVFDRLICSVYPMDDFFRKIDANPDLYGPIWISTTLVFMLSAWGNCAAYFMRNQSKTDIAWNFDVNYVNWAACVIYGYMLAVPTAIYLVLRYFETNAALVHLWCIWGYSLFIFIPTSLLMVIPVEILRWIIILLTGAASAYFIALNMKHFTRGHHDLVLLVICASILQFVFAVFVKVAFFA
ncbi:hypothetical protein HPP92_003032 [Vanilla planifolia]|uniref:Protein YIP n=1 Tax=Vanilla planifolia TaxID=51239 RepID=A0A835VMW7_VANPL|nr:hypothetical protein HPP92_003032 [Vanilla planifolia]